MVNSYWKVSTENILLEISPERGFLAPFLAGKNPVDTPLQGG